MRPLDHGQPWPRRPGVALGLALLAVVALSAALAVAAPPGPAPRLCWQRPESIPGIADEGEAASPGEVAVTDGAHPVVWLARTGAGQRRRRTSERFTVGSGSPQLFLRWPGNAILWVWAREPVGAMRHLTARVEETTPAGCADRGTGGGVVVVVEALSESRARSCVAWPLASAPAGGDLGRRTTCFPVGIPDLVGLPLAEAESILESLELVPGEIDERPAPEPLTAVLAQDPAADVERELATGDSIDLVVAGQRLVTLPPLVGTEIRQAAALLRPLDLGLAARSAGAGVALDRVEGYIIDAQEPQAGALVPVGGTATVEVSLRLPDLRGRPALETLSWLRERGLSPTMVPAGLPAEAAQAEFYSVARHRPAAGEAAQLGQTVEIGIEVTVPALRGLSVAAARRALDSRGLRLRRGSPATGDVGAERIRRQVPEAGSRLPPGSEVRIETGVLAPDIEGATVGEAARRLAARGLDLDLAGPAEVERWRSESRAHRLESQRPRPGVLVATGSAVVADLSVRVPNLLWTSARKADADLRDLGLNPGRPRPRVLRGSLHERVMAQEPQPGTWLAAGSPVQLILGPGLDPPPPEPRWPWLWLMLVAALSTSLLRPRPRKPPRQLRVEGHTDFGTQKLTAGPQTSPRPAVRLRPSWDPGRQTIETARTDKGEADA